MRIRWCFSTAIDRVKGARPTLHSVAKPVCVRTITCDTERVSAAALRWVSLRLCAVAGRSLSLRMCFRATCRPQQQSSRGLILRKRHQIFLIFFHKFLFRSPLERDLFVCPGLHWGLLRWVAPWRAALAAILASLLRRPAACADPLAPVAAQGCKSNPAEAATAIKQKDAGKKSLGLSP